MDGEKRRGEETVSQEKLVLTPKAKRILTQVLVALSVAVIFILLFGKYTAQASVNVQFDTSGGEEGMGSIQLLFLFTLLAVGPSLLLMMTSFTRLVMVFSFLRSAIGLQQTPPNQVIIGLSLFLSLFIMSPVISDINTNSITPYMNGEIGEVEALDKMQDPLKEFMLKQTKSEDLKMFMSLSEDQPELVEGDTESLKELGLEVIVPAFITSELKRAFMIGFLLYLPFLVIDMIVSSTLMSMGMVMLPPSMISMPFKLMLFVVVDGWSLLMDMLIKSFY